MIALVTVPLAILLLAVEGVLLLRALEGRIPVLFRLERYALGLLCGQVLAAFTIFFCVFAGMPIALPGFLIVHLVLLAILIPCARVRTGVPLHVLLLSDPASPRVPVIRWGIPRMLQVIFWIFVAFALLRFLAGAWDFLASPNYFDDVYANWNLRAKAFYVAHNLLLDIPHGAPFFFGGRVDSYPLTVYLTKVWLALAGGGWSDPAVNSIHLVWYCAALVLLFSALVRMVSTVWAAFGTLVLATIPLFLFHGVNAYADVLLSAHILFSVSALLQWVRCGNGREERSWLLLFAAGVAAMLFVKNEAMLIYSPPLLAVFIGILALRSKVSGGWKAFLRHGLPVLLMIGAVSLPWVGFKILHGLTFGNMQAVSGLTISLRPGVISAIVNGLLHTGSFSLLPPILLFTIVIAWRHWVRSLMGIAVLLLTIFFVGHLVIYSFTNLALEALRQTGFSRGMLHLVPLAVFVLISLVSSLLSERDA